MFKCIGRLGAAARGLAALIFACAFALSTPAFAAGYVGSELGDVKPEAKVVVANPQPVQVLFQFATKGAPNKAATKFTKAEVLAAVKASGLFSDVSEAATPNGAILSITIDNTVAPGAMNDAAAKGVVTGATLFVVGSNTRDYYTGTLEYVSGPTAAKISRTANHSIVTQMGMINSAPADAVKVEGGPKGAVMTMVRQIVSNPLNAIAGDPAFAPSTAASTTPAPSVAATPAPDAPAAEPVAAAKPATP